jgi:hypothetical protein
MQAAGLDMSHRTRALTALVAWSISFLLLFYFFAISAWAAGVCCTFIAIAIPSWVIAIKAPATCGVITQKGRPCPNPTTGVLFGCNQARNGTHVWAKLLARFGWHRELSHPMRLRATTTLFAEIPSVSSKGEGEPVTVKVEEDLKSTILFWLTACSTFAGVVSAVVAILTL